MIEKISEATTQVDSSLHFSIKKDTSLPDLGGPGGVSTDCGDKLEDEAFAMLNAKLLSMYREGNVMSQQLMLKYHHFYSGGATKAPFHWKGCRGLHPKGLASTTPVQCDGNQGPQLEGCLTNVHVSDVESQGLQLEGVVNTAKV